MKSWRKHWIIRKAAWVVLVTLTAFQVGGPAIAMPELPRPPKPPSELKPGLTQTPDAALRGKIEAKEAAVRQVPDVRPLSEKEMTCLRGRGAYRNTYFNGSLPWQRSFREVNLCNGNLFKSFTDVKVEASRGAGLVLQRTYNSNDERIGPFGVGWTHAYDIHIDEAIPGMVQTGNIGTACPTFNMTLTGNGVDRQDFFGGEHNYQRDADGLYTPPVYLHDQLTSNYLQLMANGPSEVSDDTQTDNSGTTKHFFKNGNERDCDWIQDRHENATTLQYNQPATMDDGTLRNLLTQVTDPSGRPTRICSGRPV
ncbi:MAG: DUF6531 domain-containing protein [Terracidiphilus sp.]|jgi:hypothetical protein